MWIDSHCHFVHEKMTPYATPEQIVQRAKDAGVVGMVSICCRVADEFHGILATAKKFENVWCTVGTHPHESGREAEKAVTLEQLIERATSDDKIVGIGESGLDYYYNYSPVEDQQVGFRKHIRACMETGLPLVVHARDADEDIIKILKEEGAGKGSRLSGVMHCFSSGRKMAEEAIDMDFYMSFSGIVTFKQAEELREIAKSVPMDRLLVETDAPFLAPVPFRGKVNEPSYVPHTGKVLAELKNVDIETMARQTTQNFHRLFKKAHFTGV